MQDKITSREFKEKFENSTVKNLIELYEALPEDSKTSQIPILKSLSRLFKLSIKNTVILQPTIFLIFKFVEKRLSESQYLNLEV